MLQKKITRQAILNKSTDNIVSKYFQIQNETNPLQNNVMKDII
jgi:hypothetical protein